MSDERSSFFKSHDEFEKMYNFVPRLFKHTYKLTAEPRYLWANLLLYRIIMIGNSVLFLCVPEVRERERTEIGSSLLDHSSIAALARNFLEGSVMFLYLTELGVAEEEWLLRRSVL